MKPSDEDEIRRLLPKLWRVSEEGWRRYRLAKDPLSRKIDEATGRQIAVAASSRAAGAMAELIRRFGAAAPEGWAAALGLTVDTVGESSGFAPPLLSTAERRGRRISICAGALVTVGHVVERYDLGRLADSGDTWQAMLLAHELYHHLEWLYPERYQPTETLLLWRLGPFARRAVPLAASEMAAMHFSFLATGKLFQPDVIELLFLVGRDPSHGLAWIRQVLE